MTASKGAKATKTKRLSPTPLRARARKEWEPDFLAALRVGHTKRAACSHAGVHYTTMYERAQKDPDFAASVEDAEDVGILARERELLASTPLDWRATAFYLERRRPQDWGKRDKVEHSGSVGVAVLRPPEVRIQSLMTDPTKAKALLALLDADDPGDSTS